MGPGRGSLRGNAFVEWIIGVKGEARLKKKKLSPGKRSIRRRTAEKVHGMLACGRRPVIENRSLKDLAQNGGRRGSARKVSESKAKKVSGRT